MMRTLVRMIVTIVAAGALLVGVALPAAAHGGAIHLQVVTDGAGGVSVTPTFERDGHPVEELVDPVLTATSASGKKVGPVQLVSSAEGVGVWVTESPVLEEGTWIVTVEVTTPSAATASTEIVVAPLAEPIVGEQVVPVAPDATPPMFPWVLTISALLVVTALVLLALRLRRRATTRAAGELVSR
ncbi:hypothetical protein EYE40_14670 [Glaciihabitans arcticus]|uniref:CopC domain-containing protein n=1 Tax=Glaciihabitans arcticus TaxID=2668039 RepID=A0A4Q9GUD6_9MICO|nr:hypothetical protein [Glaciihabitans arcticus]TBN55447.1 hypothetical protein EYE40_14670 [Glaciihabitans arcticus]